MAEDKNNHGDASLSDFDSEEQQFAALLPEGIKRAAAACPRPEMIRAFAEGLLTGQTAESVRLHVASCAICTTLQQDIQSADVAGPSAAQLQQMRPVQPRPVPSRLRWWQPAVVLASLAILITAVVMNRRTDASRPIPAQEATVRPAAPIEVAANKAPIEIPSSMLASRGSRISEQPTLDEWTSALSPYKDGDLGRAISALTNVTKKYPDFADGYFYLGVSQLLEAQNTDAARSLARAAELASQDRKTEAEWYLGVAQLRSRRLEEARTAWESACNGKTAYSKQACESIHLLPAPLH